MPHHKNADSGKPVKINPTVCGAPVDGRYPSNKADLAAVDDQGG